MSSQVSVVLTSQVTGEGPGDRKEEQERHGDDRIGNGQMADGERPDDAAASSSWGRLQDHLVEVISRRRRPRFAARLVRILARTTIRVVVPGTEAGAGEMVDRGDRGRQSVGRAGPFRAIVMDQARTLADRRCQLIGVKSKSRCG